MKRIWFKEEKRPYKVRAFDDRFIICTKPYNFIPNTVIYTIVDKQQNIRGTEGMVFGIHDYYNDDDCQDALKLLQNGKMTISYRNHIELNIVKID